MQSSKGKSQKPELIDNRYIIRKTLQCGGMATVYKARDVETDELVAIKYFNNDHNIPELEQEAFRREVEALQNLSHDNIVQLLDFGKTEIGKYYLVLELMKHDLLQERNKQGRAFDGWDDFSELVVSPLLSALAYAHEMSIVHRDVKPANVLVSNDGVIKLADFGISKLKRSLKPRVTLNTFMSPPFSPPEFDTGSYSYARDVYSVGILCLWAFSTCGLKDHSGIDNAINDFDAPNEIIEIINISISSDPKLRYQSASILNSELQRVQILRKRHWVKEDRHHVSLSLTNNAIDKASLILNFDDKEEIESYIQEDINLDSRILRFHNKVKNKFEIVPDHYSVVGNSYKYHIAKSNKGHNHFSLINILESSPHFIQSEKADSCFSPLTFVINSKSGVVKIKDAIKLIERAIELHEDKIKQEEVYERNNILFDTWVNTLEAKLQYERDKSVPIKYYDFQIDGNFITLFTDDNMDGVELGQGRIIANDRENKVRGDVWKFADGELVLNCQNFSPNVVPKFGQAKLDQYALKVSVDRQRNAIDSISAQVHVLIVC